MSARAKSDAQRLRRAISVMESYLDLRRELRDWHGVQDAASDLRELEARLHQLERSAT